MAPVNKKTMRQRNHDNTREIVGFSSSCSTFRLFAVWIDHSSYQAAFDFTNSNPIWGGERECGPIFPVETGTLVTVSPRTRDGTPVLTSLSATHIYGELTIPNTRTFAVPMTTLVLQCPPNVGLSRYRISQMNVTKILSSNRRRTQYMAHF